MKKLILTFALLAYAVPCFAQKAPVITFAAAATADWVTTYRYLGANGTINAHGIAQTAERNPTLRWLHSKPLPTVAVGIAMDVGFVYGWTKLMKNHHKLAASGLYVAAIARLGLAALNTHYFHVVQKF